jgi:1,4-alpha-glucan branching enzyme
MPASQQHIHAGTPMGAQLMDSGATFRVWAPGAKEVYIVLHDFDVHAPNGWQKNDTDLLVRDAVGYWAGFVPGVVDGSPYRFWVVGEGGEGYKRDPYARELALHGYPDCNCIVRDPARYPWHDQDFRPPAFNDLIIYQFHIGVFYAEDSQGNDLRPGRVSKFLDVLDRIKYLVDLGFNAILPLPLIEFPGEHSLGYNGTDLFSPEMDYAVDPADLAPYLEKANQLLAEKNGPPLTQAQLAGQIHQLKALIDICHLYGLAVLIDVVYNHAGGGFDDQSIHFFDRPKSSDNKDSIYFLGDGWAGGLVFAFWKREVRQFLMDNARFFAEEYHVDGFRYDEVRVIHNFGGWSFCQDLTGTLKFLKPSIPHIAEYWNNERWLALGSPPSGMGFDAEYHDGLRDKIRGVIAQAAGGSSAIVTLDGLRDALYRPFNFPAAWKALQYVENHDLLDANHTGNDRQPRIAALADSTNSRSWYARSRARVATGLLLTAPGIPLLFMGQEFLEDKLWSDDPHAANLLIWWAGLEGQDKNMSDHHRFTRDLIWLRRKQPALRGEDINVYHVHNDNRVIAFHRWLPGVGRDIVVVASLNETTYYDHSYQIGFPLPGPWQEVFNSDVYDHWFNPQAQGNPGGITAGGPGLHGLPYSAGVTIPANSILVFARDWGD